MVLHEQVLRRVGRQEQQCLVFERPFRLHADGFERVGPVMTDVLVQLAVLLIGHGVLRPGPQGLHRVDRLGPGLLALLGACRRHADGPGDEVRVPLDDFPDLPGRGVVEELVLGVLGLEPQGDRGALGRVLDGLDGVGALAAGLPARTGVLARSPGQQGDLVGDHEARIEPDTELSDELLGSGGVLGVLQFLEEFCRTGICDRPDQLHDLVVRHSDAVVAHGQCALLLVGLDGDMEVGRVRLERVVTESLKSQLVQRVRGIGNELTQEYVLVRINRMDHHLQELARFYLKLECLGRHGCGVPFLG